MQKVVKQLQLTEFSKHFRRMNVIIALCVKWRLELKKKTRLNDNNCLT